MGNSFRLQPGPTLYPENKTPVTEDVLEVGLVVAFAVIAFSFILIIPGIRGWEVPAFMDTIRV
jgi:dual oxidase maturation factor 1